MDSLPYSQLVPILVSLGIGLLIGLERERRQEREIFGGVRTLPLVSLTGTLVQAYFPTLLPVAFGFMAVLLALAYWGKIQQRDIGMTTAVATMLTFLYGVLCAYSDPARTLAVSLGITTAVLLAIKDPLHRFAGRIDPEEMKAVLKFLVVSLVVFPLLPDQPVDLLLGLNPRFVWWMVILVSGIGFLAYVLKRLIGTRAGIGLTGLLGGFISSTATTVALSRESTRREGLTGVAALSISLACLAMFPRVIVELLVVSPSLVMPVLGPFLLMVAAGLIPALLYSVRTGNRDRPEARPDNPFRLQPALIFGFLFGLILIATDFALKLYGNQGMYLASAISGVADVDAITLSVARLVNKGSLSRPVARNALILAAVTNTLVKVGLTWVLGRVELARTVTVVMGASILGGAVGILVF